MRVPFNVVVPNVQEINDQDSDPQQLVLRNASLKANAVLADYPNDPVLAADTTVALDGKIFNKPNDLNEARDMLRTLSDREHSVYTGICLIYKPLNINIKHCEVSNVRLLKLNDSMIDHYFSLINPLDKAGAFGIQEHPECIIHSYKGHMSNIIGLPIEFLYSLFHKFPILKRDTTN